MITNRAARKIVNLVFIIFFSFNSTYAQNNSNYTYDSQGRLVMDRSEGIKTIIWNNQNKITHIIRADTSHAPDLELAYDKYGHRVMKLIKPRNGVGLLPENLWRYIFYNYDSHGQVLTRYERSYETQEEHTFTEKIIIDHSVIYGNVRLGTAHLGLDYVRRTFTADLSEGIFVNQKDQGILRKALQNEHTSRRMQRQYEMANYLGHVQTVVSDRKTQITNPTERAADVASAFDYEAFGMAAPNRLFQNIIYNYGFSGQEKDDEVKGKGNSYYFEARLYDPRIGKWLTIDPLANQYPGLSPYAFVANSPLMLKDPDGRKIELADGSSDSFKKKYQETAKFLKSKGAGWFLTVLENSKYTYVIKEIDAKTQQSQYISNEGGKGGIILWDPSAALYTTENHRLSPATMLNHELDHAYFNEKFPHQSLKNTVKWLTPPSNPDYETKEEERVIKGSEQLTALRLGEIKPGQVTRKNHYGTLYQSIGPTSTIPAPIPPGKVRNPAPKKNTSAVKATDPLITKQPKSSTACEKHPTDVSPQQYFWFKHLIDQWMR